MASLIALAKLKSNAARFTLPQIKSYNRLEVSPRSKDFQRNLSMECHDPLWFLCRQWQFGEFQAEDAATACEAKIMGTHTTPGEIEYANGQKKTIPQDCPLETLVEQESVIPTLHLRAQMGRYLIKLLTQHKLKKYALLLAKDFPLPDTLVDEDSEGIFLSQALSTTLADGFDIHSVMQRNEFQTWYAGNPAIDVADHPTLASVQTAFLSWFAELYQQPEKNQSAWQADRLEYNFKLNARHEKTGARTLIADQYPGGRLDWESFDQQLAPRRRNISKFPAPSTQLQNFIPTVLTFSGMPHPRLWQLENNTVNFGKIDASSTSVMNVLLAEYGLNYSNDWFVLPYELPLNTLCQIEGILVKDVFGQNIYIKPAIEDPETRWQEFALFHQTERDNATKNKSIFYLPPALSNTLESEDLERVNFIRDEMSNMVWGIEQVLLSEAGSGRQLTLTPPQKTPFEPIGTDAEIRYILGNPVPSNWIPFTPVHKPVAEGEVPKEIRLQRAKMPQSPGPSSELLSREQPVYFIEENEIPRAGIIVSSRFQRTRWVNGKTLLWLGLRKKNGRGEGAANLQYDEIVGIK